MKIGYFYTSSREYGFLSSSIHIFEFMEAVKQLNEDIIPFNSLAVNLKADTWEKRIYLKINKKLPDVLKDILALINNFITCFKGIKFILKVKPDIIIVRNTVFDFYFLVLKKLLNIPVLLEVNTPLYYERVVLNYGARRVYLTNITKYVEKNSWQKVDMIMCVSKSLKKIIVKEGIDSNKIYAVHNGVNIKKFNHKLNGNDVREKYCLTEKFVIGYVGGFYKYHGLKDIICQLNILIKKFGNINLMLIGDGPTKKICQEITYDLGMEEYITFAGFQPHESIPEYISAFDLAIIPSFTPYGSPIKLFEYMAMKKIALVPDFSPILEIIKNKKTGIVFKKNNINSLIDEIEWANKNKRLCEEIAENAYKICMKNYTWTNNASKVINICRELTNS